MRPETSSQVPSEDWGVKGMEWLHPQLCEFSLKGPLWETKHHRGEQGIEGRVAGVPPPPPFFPQSPWGTGRQASGQMSRAWSQCGLLRKHSSGACTHVLLAPFLFSCAHVCMYVCRSTCGSQSATSRSSAGTLSTSFETGLLIGLESTH